MTTWPWAKAELYAARARIAELEARLAAVVALCDDYESQAYMINQRDAAREFFVAATGADPEERETGWG